MLGEWFCYAMKWKPGPGELFHLYLDGVEVPYGGNIRNTVIESRLPAPYHGPVEVKRLRGAQDRHCFLQTDLADEQIAEYCLQGGW